MMEHGPLEKPTVAQLFEKTARFFYRNVLTLPVWDLRFLLAVNITIAYFLEMTTCSLGYGHHIKN
jgi:hypothetical protein